MGAKGITMIKLSDLVRLSALTVSRFSKQTWKQFNYRKTKIEI